MSTFVRKSKRRTHWLAEGVKAFIYSGLTVLALACTSADRRIEDIVVYPTPTENPSDEIQKLRAEVDEARKRNVDVLSPTWFQSAENSLAAAQRIQQQGGDYRQLFRRTAEGRVQIQRANEVASTSEKMVSDVLKAREEASSSRQQALESGATDVEALNRQLRNADERLMKLTTAIENNNLDNMVDRRTDAIRAYREVQAAALRKGKLDTAKRVVQEAERQNARKFAPKSLSYAKAVIDSADKLISTQPQAQEDINRRSDEALFYARRALLVTQEARDIARREPEDTVLWFEQGLSTIAEQAGAQDLRDEKFDSQISALRTHVASLRQSMSSGTKSNTVQTGPTTPSGRPATTGLGSVPQPQQSMSAFTPAAEAPQAESVPPATTATPPSKQTKPPTKQRQQQQTKQRATRRTSPARSNQTTVIRQHSGDKVTVTIEPSTPGEAVERTTKDRSSEPRQDLEERM